MYALVGGCMLCKCVEHGCTHCGWLKLDGMLHTTIMNASQLDCCKFGKRRHILCIHAYRLDGCMLTGLLRALLLRQNACMMIAGLLCKWLMGQRMNGCTLNGSIHV